MPYTISQILSLLSLFITSCSIASAGIGDLCNFDKYATGCYNQANFVCDINTGTCICHPETPVLISSKVCVRKSRENETCQYNEQCDIDNGLYCSYSDLKLLNSCTPVGLIRDNPKAFSNQVRCRCIKLKLKNSIHKTIPGPQQSGRQQSHDQDLLPLHSNLPRLIWLFLIVCLIGLMILLLMMKSQYYRINRYPNTQDDISIASAADVPPPYEVAIRMKL